MKTATSKVSSKYQIVIPKQIRNGLNVKPGQRVYLSSNKANEITVKTDSQIARLQGKYAGLWGPDPLAYQKEIRKDKNYAP